MGAVCTFQYNGLKQMISKVVQAADASIGYYGPALSQSWSYDAYGRLTDERCGSDPTTHYSLHDVYGRPYATQAPWGAVTSSEFDGLGNKISETPPSPRGSTTYQYDEVGALWKTVSPTGTTRQKVQLPYTSGPVTVTKDSRGYVTKTSSDYLGRPRFSRRFAQPVGGELMDPAPSNDDIETQIVYDAVGNPIQEIDGKGASTVHTYDSLDRRVRTVYPDGTERVWQYDAAGNVVKAYDGRGRTTTMTYDWANRLRTVVYPAGSDTANVEHHYRADGLEDWMTDGTGRTDYKYSKAKQLVSCIQPFANTSVSYTYDEAGRSKTVKVGAQTWTYNYSLGLLGWIDATLGNAQPASYGYYADGSIDAVTYGNGYKTKYAYDGSGRIVDIWHRNPQNVDQKHLTYGYGGTSNITTIIDVTAGMSSATTTNVYDFADRLTSETRIGGLTVSNAFAYAYDKAGNRLSTTRNGLVSTYATASNDRFISGDGWTMPLSSYDGNGNPTQISGPRGAWNLVYDADNRMIRVTAANGSFDTFRYNGDGVRVEQVSVAGTNRYVLDGEGIVAIADGTNKIVEYRLAGVGTVVPAATAGGAATNLYDETDVMGSTVGARDGAGVAVRKDNYDAYGNPEQVLAGPWRASRFAGGHGYVSDFDTGFDLCGARYYIPALGRFLTQDPIGHEGGLNLYSYCGNNPLMRIDPEGTQDFMQSMQNAFGLHTQGDINHFYGGLAKGAADAGLGTPMGTMFGAGYYSYKGDTMGMLTSFGALGLNIGFAALGEEGNPIWRTTDILSSITAEAAIGARLTPAQMASLLRNPGLASAHWGTQIDTLAKNLATTNTELTRLGVEITPRGKFGPDFFMKSRKAWWDITTSKAWPAHVAKYERTFGKGIHLKY